MVITVTQIEKVLVGIDGSMASNAALLWAAGEARVRNAELVIAHVCDSRAQHLWSGDRATRDQLRARSAPIIDAAMVLTKRVAPDVAVEARVVLGPQVHTLLRLGDAADLVVLGPRGRGSAESAFWLGSVTQQIMAHTTTPAVSVSIRSTTERRVDPSRLIVGVHDIGAKSAASVDFTFAEASRRSASVLVVHAESDDVHTKNGIYPWLSPWHRRFPEVELQTLLCAGSPADALLRVSSASDLLVLGRHRAAGDQASRLGTVALDVLTRALCPVALVPDGAPRS